MIAIQTGARKSIAKNWIDGGWADSVERRDSFDPATGQKIGTYAYAGRDDVGRAVIAAERAFRTSSWKHDRHLRARALNAMAERFTQRRVDLIDLLALDNGKVKPEAAFEVDFVPAGLRLNAALALADCGRACEVGSGRVSMLLRQPMGVAGVIAPWSSPVAHTIRSLAPALAAGCTAVVKLPTETAQINALFAEVVGQTEGLPPGVVNLVTSGWEAAGLLIESPDVPTLSFTGSTRSGRAISATGAPLKRVGLELCGNTPMIVFESADLDAAIPVMTKAVTVFAGQFCMTGGRLLVERSIAGEVRRRMAESLSKVKAGPAADPTSDMGPMIDKQNVERVNQMVEQAITAGARVVVRGGPVTEGPLAAGAFYRPTLLEVDDSRLEIVQQEVFGPVLTLEVFDGEAEAISRANDSEHGLAASIWSRDVDQPLRVARELESGTVWVNDWAAIHDEFYEGGYKQRGQGRLRGLTALEDFVQYKHIALRPGVSG
jgi:acyl-CoA reductase-like NAD-dependent aldehyde dehydrogenase